jgi:hypothetical protein
MELPKELIEQGIAVVALLGVSYYVIRLTNFLFTNLTGSLDEHKEITIKLIDGLNSLRTELNQLKIELAELKEQHRNYHDLFIISDRQRLPKRKDIDN